MAPPISFGLGLSLARAGGAALDADAAAYIAAVETAGATVSGGQKAAIDTFVKTGKSDGWYSSLKRLYLPIWASAAPNAVDMVTRTSGTFNGTVTHSAGYAAGDAATGYFDFGVSPSTLGLTASNGGYTFLKKATGAATTIRPIGVWNSSTQNASVQQTSTVHNFDWNSIAGSGRLSLAADGLIAGIMTYNRQGGDRRMERRISSGFSLLASATAGDVGTIPTLNIWAMAFNQAGVVGGPTDAEFGSYAAHLGMTSAQSTAFTLALKDLWETSTGLTLP